MLIKIENSDELLDKFAEAVKQHKYLKVEYNTWKLLVRYKFVSIDIQPNSDYLASVSPHYRITIESPSGTQYEFFNDDNSFGKFLFDNIMEYYSTTTVPYNNYVYSPDVTTTIDWSSISNITTTGTNCFTFTYNNEPTKKEEEKKDMNLFKNFEFGSCENDNVKLSPYGIAVKNAAGTYVSYDPKTESIFDVDVFNFNAKFLYKLPIAIKDIAIGDTIIHNRKPVFVTRVETGKVLAVDPAAGEEKIILPTKSPFGFDFVVKIVNILGNFSNTATADSPFGNMLPLIALSDGASADTILPFLLMGNNKEINPLMLYFLMKDGNKGNKDMTDVLPFLLYANPNGFTIPTFGATTPVEKESSYKTE